MYQTQQKYFFRPFALSVPREPVISITLFQLFPICLLNHSFFTVLASSLSFVFIHPSHHIRTRRVHYTSTQQRHCHHSIWVDIIPLLLDSVWLATSFLFVIFYLILLYFFFSFSLPSATFGPSIAQRANRASTLSLVYISHFISLSSLSPHQTSSPIHLTFQT